MWAWWIHLVLTEPLHHVYTCRLKYSLRPQIFENRWNVFYVLHNYILHRLICLFHRFREIEECVAFTLYNVYGNIPWAEVCLYWKFCYFLSVRFTGKEAWRGQWRGPGNRQVMEVLSDKQQLVLTHSFNSHCSAMSKATRPPNHAKANPKKYF